LTIGVDEPRFVRQSPDRDRRLHVVEITHEDGGQAVATLPDELRDTAHLARIPRRVRGEHVDEPPRSVQPSAQYDPRVQIAVATRKRVHLPSDDRKAAQDGGALVKA
jgi:hypothetical protein